jgi:hypothetical protein
MLAMSTSPPSAGASSCASAATASSAATAAGAAPSCAPAATTSSAVAARVPRSLEEQGLALQLRQELFNSGGWATTPSGLPHCVPLAFVAPVDVKSTPHAKHTASRKS